MTTPIETLEWSKAGEQHLEAALGRVTDEELGAPSLLPGWSRQHLLAHLACNADALVNLSTWARTGVETPMYASPEARESGIRAMAALPPGQLRAEVSAAARRLTDALGSLSDEAWVAEVRTAQGRTVPASQIPWMRCREVWVHAVDLDAGVGFGDIPERVLAALVDDVFRMWQSRDELPDATVVAGDRAWGAGTVTVEGSLPAVTAWVTGRSAGEQLEAHGPLPARAAWL